MIDCLDETFIEQQQTASFSGQPFKPATNKHSFKVKSISVKRCQFLNFIKSLNLVAISDLT